jgi:uncharacterized membrane protein
LPKKQSLEGIEMILWSVFWGAVAGAMTAYDAMEGLSAGALLGLLAGWTLQRSLRTFMQAERRRWASEPGPAAVPAAPDRAALESAVDSALANEQRTEMPLPIDPAAATIQPLRDQSLAEPLPGLAGADSASETGNATTQPLRPTRSLPATPAKPAGTPWVEQAWKSAQAWLLGGNTILRVGLLVLFIGLAFLARQAVHMGLLPVELRLAAIGLAGLALTVWGFRQRATKPGLALSLQGGGVAVLYLTVFAAFKLYGLLDPLPAFGLMVLICALSCALALLQDGRSLAVVAFLGGFATPVLLSTGGGSHVALFSYYLLLNLAILFMAYRRSWRVLNLVGFFSTFVIAGAWGVLSYKPEHYASTQPFLIAFLLIFVAASVLYARHTPTRLGSTVDSTLVFGTPLVGFGLQAGLVADMPWGLAFSATAMGLLYLTLALLLRRRGGESYRLLTECFTALGAGFATLAVPLAVDGRWVSLVWALEGLGAFWVGMRQARWMPRAAGLVLVGVSALMHLDALGARSSALPLLHPALWHGLVLALVMVVMAGWLRSGPLAHSGTRWATVWVRVEQALPWPLYLGGVGYACLAWLLEVSRLGSGNAEGSHAPVFDTAMQPVLTLVGWMLVFALSLWWGRRKAWPVATWPARCALPALLLCWLWQAAEGVHAFEWPALPGWLISLALHVWMLRHVHTAQRTAAADGATAPGWWMALHAGTAWLAMLLLADVLWMGIDAADLWITSWASVVWLLSAVLVLAGLCIWAGRANRPALMAQQRWPLNPCAPAYYAWATTPLALLVFVGTLMLAWTSSGDTRPLPYVPLLNPVELTLALALVALMLWRKTLLMADPPAMGSRWLATPKAPVALGALVFVAINTVWLRVAHHFFGVPWRADSLFESFVVQTGYAILWSLMAMALMLTGHRRARRPWWMVGAALLAVVVVKLLLIDLSNAGGVERTVAFIAVGVLMLLVGYFAPLPPKKEMAAPAEPPAQEVGP